MISIRSILVLLASSVVLVSTLAAGQLDSRLAERVAQSQPDEKIKVWIKTEQTENPTALKARAVASASNRVERHALVITALKRQAERQQPLLDELSLLQSKALAGEPKGHWIVNVVEAEVAAGELSRLAARNDVEAIYIRPETNLIATEWSEEVSPAPADISSVQGNLEHIRADEAWGMGYTGAGRLVCSFDTGIEGNHPALYGSWRGHDGDSAAAWFDPVFGEPFPHAVTSIGWPGPAHGTHTTGIMVAADPDSHDTLGVAPGAEWIGAAVVDIPGASVLDAFEWAADPDRNPNTVDDVPDVINHSWGYRDMDCLNIFYDAIEYTEALGIVNIFAGGNFGSAAASMANPANRALDSIDCFAVGYISHLTESIMPLSSRGPSPCDNLSIKPNVVAPGDAIVSTDYNLTNKYRELGGTSQAAPHVSGLVALLRQKNPDATVDEIKTAILTSTQTHAGWGTLPNNDYGWGEIDCVAALNALPDVGADPHLRLYDFDHLPAQAGDTVRGTIVLQNLGGNESGVQAVVLNSNPALEVLDGLVSFGSIPSGDTVRSTSEVEVVVADSVTTGSIISTLMVLSGDNTLDTVQLHFLVGVPPMKSSVDHTGGRIEFTLTDYGVFGMGDGSMYPLNGVGFTFDGGSNDLYEGGLMIGTGYGQVSSGVHDYLWEPRMDFRVRPEGEIELTDPGPIAAQQTWAEFNDSGAANPVGLDIIQESFLYAPPNDDILVLRYILTNASGGMLNDLYVGLFLDFDLYVYDRNSGGYEANEDFLWMAFNSSEGVPSRCRGVKLLEGPLGAAAAARFEDFLHYQPPSGNGFDAIDKYNVLSSGLLYGDANKTTHRDMFLVSSAGPLTLSDGQLDTVTFAIMAADSLEQLREVAVRAESVPTPVEEDSPSGLLPSQFVLHQNYPNPFNPETLISFELPRRSSYRLEIINVLGQTIMEQTGLEGPGQVELRWLADGFASGAYFYRLTVGEQSQTRKMMLLK